jgi:2'-5' RNA ligase
MTTPRIATESALLIAVPEAEDAVSSWRDRLDPAARLGVPAHITLLYPFEHPGALDDNKLRRLRAVLGAVRRFDFSLKAVRWFGDQVVYLAPDPDEPFRRLTQVLTKGFPEFPPYGGAFAEVVPHLTVGDGGPPALLADAADAVRHKLPIRSTATEVVLMVGLDAPASWSVHERFPLKSS